MFGYCRSLSVISASGLSCKYNIAFEGPLLLDLYRYHTGTVSVYSICRLVQHAKCWYVLVLSLCSVLVWYDTFGMGWYTPIRYTMITLVSRSSQDIVSFSIISQLLQNFCNLMWSILLLICCVNQLIMLFCSSWVTITNNSDIRFCCL